MSEKRYESTFLLPTTMSDDALSASVKHFEDVITKAGAKLIETERWGIRRLAYQIGKQTSGHYYSMHYTAKGDVNAKLERAYHLDENVLRWLTLEMPEENHKARTDMKARIETIEARRIAHAAKAEGGTTTTEAPAAL
ncbi:MAG TPA: 30S ribosomal protein S6 [Candidatus Kapabacteria bacterium]|nr:30S ribosomal protein S6 [Candidatus Kapabacteria bacterium]